MTLKFPWRFVAASLLSGLAGWLLRGPALLPQDATHPAGHSSAAAAASTPVPPAIIVSSGGLVTLRVQAQPLDWLLDQIVAQGGLVGKERRSLLTVAAPALAAATASGCPAAGDPAGLRSGQVLRALQQGNADDRFQAILCARNEGIVIPEPVLKSLFETDAADAVRLLALEA